MKLTELQKAARISGSIQVLNREVKRLLWHEGTQPPEGDEEKLARDRRITVGAIAYELAAYCNHYNLDLEQCVEEANAKEVEEVSK